MEIGNGEKEEEEKEEEQEEEESSCVDKRRLPAPPANDAAVTRASRFTCPSM